MTSRFALVLRACAVFVGGAAGLLLAERLIAADLLSGALNTVYLTTLGLLVGYLLTLRFAHRVETSARRLGARLARIPPDSVLAAGLGTTVALIVTVLLNVLLEAVPGYAWYWSLLIAAVLVTASSWFFVANKRMFALGASPGPGPHVSQAPGQARPKVLDTSAIIDGRVAEVATCGFLDGPLVVPRFVLGELQKLADADDSARRKRGRRGLEVLETLRGGGAVEFSDDDLAGVREVDSKLVWLCQRRSADLITTDFNLGRVATFQGVRVLNVNELASALRAVLMAGEVLSLQIVKSGREPGQGLGYLDDGTMVVVEDAAHLLGATAEVTVTSNLQTNVGRMVFARLRQSG